MADNTGEPIGIFELEGNLADAEKPPELRNGMYRAELQGVEVKTSGNSGNRYFAVKFVIPTEELSADIKDDYPDGAIMYWNRQLVPDKQDRRTLFNLKKFIMALGLDANTTKLDPNEWMGCSVRLKVEQSAYEGEMRAQIKAVEAAENEAPSRTARDQAPARARGGRGKTATAVGRAR